MAKGRAPLGRGDNAFNWRRRVPTRSCPNRCPAEEPATTTAPDDRSSRRRLTLVRITVRKTRPPDGPVFWTGLRPRKVAVVVIVKEYNSCAGNPFGFVYKYSRPWCALLLFCGSKTYNSLATIEFVLCATPFRQDLNKRGVHVRFAAGRAADVRRQAIYVDRSNRGRARFTCAMVCCGGPRRW